MREKDDRKEDEERVREKDDRKEDEERVREEDKGKGGEIGMKKKKEKKKKKRQMTQGCVVCLHVLNHCVTLTFGSY